MALLVTQWLEITCLAFIRHLPRSLRAWTTTATAGPASTRRLCTRRPTLGRRRSTTNSSRNAPASTPAHSELRGSAASTDCSTIRRQRQGRMITTHGRRPATRQSCSSSCSFEAPRRSCPARLLIRPAARRSCGRSSTRSTSYCWNPLTLHLPRQLCWREATPPTAVSCAPWWLGAGACCNTSTRSAWDTKFPHCLSRAASPETNSLLWPSNLPSRKRPGPVWSSSRKSQVRRATCVLAEKALSVALDALPVLPLPIFLGYPLHRLRRCQSVIFSKITFNTFWHRKMKVEAVC